MRDGRSQPALPGRHAWWLGAALGAAFAAGCATGIDVTDGELAEICSEPGTTCGGVSNVGGSAGGTAIGGGGSSGSLGSVGGSSNASGGSLGAGLGGRAGSVGSGGGQAGSSSASGGGGGAAGSGASLPLPEGDCLEQSDVVVLYQDRSNGATTNNQVTMVLSVQNNGPAFDLTALTLRYWFSSEVGTAFSFNVDYATFDGQQNLSSATQVTFGQELGSNYAEIGFSMAGSVDAAGIREVQLRFYADGYPNMDQSNDFSFLGGATAGTVNPNITPYVSGEQVGGCVPAP